ncbi:hypothetical protein QM012_001762 [Aureobasidium pullulans]|uniref:Uncharacterized protein n=1 Tax=Aureobasidium pullulans TaxID=5580 RepID=A0ABR0TCY7_AURPU
MSPPSIAEILKDSQFQPELVERIAFRTSQPPLEVHPYNPSWPNIFLEIKERILTALGDTAIAIHHTGSTSVPGLPAKDIIDIDLVVRDSTKETEYVQKLEDAGFKFLLREPHWHQHRFFYTYQPYAVNLHVWSPNCPEVVRHQIFRQRLLDCPEDMALYLKAKELAASQIREQGGNMADYNLLKENTIRQILRNAFKDLGYIS